jgi:hypothetical protein
MSATSDYKVSGNKSDFSATSMMDVSDNKVGGMRHSLSPTSILNSENMLLNFSATSPTPYMKGGFDNKKKVESVGATRAASAASAVHALSKMDLIRQKIKELESSDIDIFQKNKVTQSGGGDKKKINQGKQVVGINSSSTDSLCE